MAEAEDGVARMALKIVCDFCLREIGPEEPAREIMVGERFQHLSFACEGCLPKADRLERIRWSGEASEE